MLKTLTPKVCIIGGGPAGFYAAQYLTKHLKNVQIDLIEKLPVPFGLIRYGVAPDHPEVKNVINTFNKIAEQPNFKFFGNVKLGEDITLKNLQEIYHAVLLTYGASRERTLGVPGETLSNVISARNFVCWYNSYPGYDQFKPDLSKENVCIFGNGNVAVDVARILIKHVDFLKNTDIADYALQALSESKVKNVYMVGRRGPIQAAFTTKELREILNLEYSQTVWRKDDFKNLQDFNFGTADIPRPKKRLLQLMLDSVNLQSEIIVAPKRIYPVFYRAPIDISKSSTKLGITVLKNDYDINANAILTRDIEFLESDLYIKSIGYVSEQLDSDIPFDTTSKRVVNQNGVVRPGLYTTGWLATGSQGVLINTMSNTFTTSKLIVNYFNEGLLNGEKPGSEEFEKILKSRNVKFISWNGWKKIDDYEIAEGKKNGKCREKVNSIDKMVEIGFS